MQFSSRMEQNDRRGYQTAPAAKSATASDRTNQLVVVLRRRLVVIRKITRQLPTTIIIANIHPGTSAQTGLIFFWTNANPGWFRVSSLAELLRPGRCTCYPEPAKVSLDQTNYQSIYKQQILVKKAGKTFRMGLDCGIVSGVTPCGTVTRQTGLYSSQPVWERTSTDW